MLSSRPLGRPRDVLWLKWSRWAGAPVAILRWLRALVRWARIRRYRFRAKRKEAYRGKTVYRRAPARHLTVPNHFVAGTNENLLPKTPIPNDPTISS